MELFSKKEFEKLAERHEPNCVSIYIPTHRSNENGDAMQRDRIHLKNQLQEAEKQLSAFGMKENEAKQYLRPIADLLDKTDFWLHNSDGLSIFLAGDALKIHRIPSFFDPFTFVGTHFYLKPLSPLMHDFNRHFILNLSLGGVTLYEVTEQTIMEVQTPKKLPQGLEDAVGYDYEEKHLQQRTGQGERGEATGIYHGHGSSNQSEKKEEALEYFRKIDEIVTLYLNDIKEPLVVACVDYLFPIYCEANTYNHLVEDHLSGNMESVDPLLLAEKSREIFHQQDESKLRNKKQRFEEALSNGLAGLDNDAIIPAAISGRVETLFVNREKHEWGTYEKETHAIRTSQVRRVGESDLLDVAATHTVLNNGEVHLLSEDEMPAPEKSSNAIFRYSRRD